VEMWLKPSSSRPRVSFATKICKFYLREKMRSRHASMSFIISVEANNIPR
jgi:hypothetical protein